MRYLKMSKIPKKKKKKKTIIKKSKCIELKQYKSFQTNGKLFRNRLPAYNV